MNNQDIKEAKIEGVARLAKWLGLDVTEYSERQIRKLVKWRIGKFDTARMY